VSVDGPSARDVRPNAEVQQQPKAIERAKRAFIGSAVCCNRCWGAGRRSSTGAACTRAPGRGSSRVPRVPHSRAPAHGFLARRPGGYARSRRACRAARARGRPAWDGRRRSPRRRSPPKNLPDERRPCAVPSGALQTSRNAVDRLVGPPPNVRVQQPRRCYRMRPEAAFRNALVCCNASWTVSRITHSYAVGDHPVLRTGFA
jgi:hypothetical protein